MQICDELSHDMATQEGLTVATQANPLLPKSSCSATLRAAGSGIEVNINRVGQTLDITIRRHTCYGTAQPDPATERVRKYVLTATDRVTSVWKAFPGYCHAI